MTWKQTSLILASFIILLPTTSGFGKGRVRKYLLRDGFLLRRVDGKLTTQDSNEGVQGNSDRWFFEFDSDVTDGRGRVKAGTRLELLPSATLEKMVADMKKRSEAGVVGSRPLGTTAAASQQASNGADYRLWARVTKYRGRNFILPTNFSPLSRQPKPSISEKSQQKEEKPTINEPNDILPPTPQDIIEELKNGKIVRKIAPTEWLEKGLELKQDPVLADRIGFIWLRVTRDAYRVKRKTEEEKTQNAKRNTQYGFFVFDALGRNIQQARFRLLPCEALERAEQQRSAELDPIRFKIAGIVTRYKGELYLLLQKATRVYSHESFGR